MNNDVNIMAAYEYGLSKNGFPGRNPTLISPLSMILMIKQVTGIM